MRRTLAPLLLGHTLGTGLGFPGWLPAGRPEFEELAMAVHDRLEGFVDKYGGLLPMYFNPESGGEGKATGRLTITLGVCVGWL
jgi:hypothetical protein